MRNFFLSSLARRLCGLTMATAVAVAIVGCNGGADGGGLSGGGTTTPTPVGGVTPVPKTAQVVFNPTTANLVLGQQKDITATVLDSNGKAVSGAVVTFTTDATLGLVKPNARITGEDGKAVVTLSVASISSGGSVGSLAASASYTDASGTKQTVSGSMVYQVGDSSVSLDSVTLGSTTIDAYSTTDIAVKVSVNGTPLAGQSVNLNSSCASAGKASIDASAQTDANGIARGSFTDKGCSNTDTITASISGSASTKQASLVIKTPAAASLQFVSVTPSNGLITLGGYASAARPDTAQIKFKLVDASNVGIQGKSVQVSLLQSNAAPVNGGAATLQNAVNNVVTTTTNATGEVTVTVKAGKLPTPVSAKAVYSDASTTISSQSSVLTISTGFPDQDSLSMSAERSNFNGWNYDGATTTITMRMADHFNNPVPDGTAFIFITDSGRIGQGTQGSCVTVNSACSITLSSQNPRLTNPPSLRGRVHVLAYSVGEESFADLNNSYDFDDLAELIDANGKSSDIGEAFLDRNENRVYDLGTDTLVDFNGDGVYNGPDGKFNGTLCKPGFAGCATQATLNVFAQRTFIMSSDNPQAPVPVDSAAPYGNAPIVLSCADTSPTKAAFYIPDENGNILPSKTAISISVVSGTASIVFGASNTVADAAPPINTRAGNQTVFGFSLQTPLTGCVAGTGSLNVTISAPDHGGGTAKVSTFNLPYLIQ